MLEDIGIGLLIMVAVGVIAAIIIALLVRRGYQNKMARKVSRSATTTRSSLKHAGEDVLFERKHHRQPFAQRRQVPQASGSTITTFTRKQQPKIEPTLNRSDEVECPPTAEFEPEESFTNLADEVNFTEQDIMDEMGDLPEENPLSNSKPTVQEINIHPMFVKQPAVDVSTIEANATVAESEAEDETSADVLVETPPASKYGVSDACPEHIIIRIMANQSQPYIGYELLQALLSAGFRYGKMDIFHHHDDEASMKPILFSLASATEPGTFDLSNIGGQICEGLTVFMDVKKQSEPAAVFEKMLTACNQLVDDLGGTLYDVNLKRLTESTIDQWRGLLAVEVV